MYDKEDRHASHLIILISYTLFTVALVLEGILLDWETKTLWEVAAGLIACWVLHIAGKVPESVERWLYFILMSLGFMFYGSHETSVYDLAPVIILVMVVFFAAREREMIWLCAALYFVVLLYGFIFCFRDTFEFTALSITRLLLHGALVCAMAYMTKFISDRQSGTMQSMQEQIAELDESNRRTEDFLTNVSHELRTPVNAVTGLTSLMLKNEPDNDKRENLLSVQKAGYRLFGQVEDILDFTEIDTGRITVSEENYMLSSLINDVITETNNIQNKPAVEMIFDVEAKIPAMLSGDGRKIKKIIRHLLDNAIKFTEQGGVYVRIYALPKSYGINLCIQVTDTGMGMDAESLSKVTERFYQSSRGRDRRAGGLGLGLPIVYGLASAMEGFVHVESQLGKGMTVTVSIPQKIVDEAPGMSVDHPTEICVGCYLMPEKYKVPEVRRFYDEMITHMAGGLDITVHRVFKQDELETLVSMYRLTHLFLAREEYEQDPDYFENLDEDTIVVVVADPGFAPRQGSRVKLLPKPFYCFPVVNVLNSSASDQNTGLQNKRMICPGVRALVVDDEPMNRMVAEGIFKEYQMQVVTVGSGREAIEMCRNEEFDILFIDHMMPEMDGVETLKQIRKLDTESTDMFTAVAFTANAVSGAKEMFLREGFDDFLSKPVEIPELEHVFKKVLPKARIQYVDEQEAGTAAAAPEEKTDRSAGGADTQTQAPAGDDRMSRLKSVGVNTDSGLNYCRNDEAFYMQLLEKFVSDAPKKAQELNRLYEEKDYGNYRIQVHSLKSSAKMIGADALSQTAKELEDAAKESDAVYIRSHHKELLDEYQENIRLITEAVESGGSAGSAAAPDAAQELADTDAQALSECLGGLKDSLTTYEADKAQSIIEQLNGMVYQGTPVKEMIQPIAQNVQDFEFEEAADKTAALIGRVEGGEAG